MSDRRAKWKAWSSLSYQEKLHRLLRNQGTIYRRQGTARRLQGWYLKALARERA